MMGGMGMGGKMMSGMVRNMMGGIVMGRNMIDGMGMCHKVSYGNHNENKNEKISFLKFITCLFPSPLNFPPYLMTHPLNLYSEGEALDVFSPTFYFFFLIQIKTDKD